MTKDMIKFDLPKNKSSIIKVLGVGGGGSNAVNHMFCQGIEGVDFFVCNTDCQALEMSPVPNKMQLGVNLTEGRGAGSIPEVGRQAAIEDLDRIKEILHKNTKMLFITAGMGGGTGTGAAPVIAKASKEMGVLTVGIVTIPFSFEGRKRKQQADEGIRELKEHTDTLLIICNDRLRELYGNLSVSNAFAQADNVLTTAAKGIAEIITLTGNINVDFADVKTVMSNSGVAIMGSGGAEGEQRAEKAVQAALSSPLLNDNQIKGASNILLNITSGAEEILMDEITEITDYIQMEAGSSAEIIWGLGKDESLGNQINVTLVATGFDAGQHLGYELGKTATRKKVMNLETGQTDKQGRKQPTEKPVEHEVEGIKFTTKTQAKEADSAATAPRNYVFDFALGKQEKGMRRLHEVSQGPDKESAASGKSQAGQLPDEAMQKKIREREARLRELSIKLKTPDGLDDLEKQPAFVRRNVVLSNVKPSDESQVSRYTLQETPDKQLQIKSNNSFLHDNVD